MTHKHQTTREEEAYWRLLDETAAMASEAARTVFAAAYGVTYAEVMVHSYCVQPEEYDEAEEEMRLAAAELTTRDRELLTEIVRAAQAASASLDPDDFHTIAGYNVYVGDLHLWYKVKSAMIEEILREGAVADNLQDPSDIPF